MTTRATVRAVLWLALGALAVALVVPLVLAALALPADRLPAPDGPGLLWLVGLAALAAVALVALRALYRVVAARRRGDSSLESLRLAYARGDLSDGDFERRRRGDEGSGRRR